MVQKNYKSSPESFLKQNMENSSVFLYFQYVFSWFGFLTVVFPILFPIFLIVYIFRAVVIIFAKVFRRDLLRRLDSYEYLYSIDKLYKKPFSNNAVIVFTNENLTLEQVHRGFTYNVLEHKQFSKFTLYPQEFCSYFFWKKVQYFHIREYTREVTLRNQRDIDGFLSEWISQPFGKGKSPWEIVLLRFLDQNDSTALVLKVHNTISSGFSLNEILQAIIPSSNQSEIVPVQNNSKLPRAMFNNVDLLLKFPYILCKMYTQEIFNHEYSLNTPRNCEIVCSRMEIQMSPMKTGAENMNRKVTSCFAEALSRFHLERNGNNNFLDNKNAFSPKNGSTHNNNSRGIPNFSINFSFSEPILRLLETEDKFTQENKHNIKEITRKHVPLLSILPKRILRAIFRIPGTPLIRHNSIPCCFSGENSNFLWKNPVSSVYFINGLFRPNLGITLTSIPSINKTGYCFTLSAGKDIIPDQHTACRIMQYFKQELDCVT